VAILAIPISIGMAVLRYRLYDIDRIISRTLSYAILTVVLLGVYATGVLAVGWLFRAVTGGGGGDLVVATSTLTVAALFGPARHRIQLVVDRRFNRARFDAQRTTEQFGHDLRDEVNLDELADQLLVLAAATMRPRVATVWVRSAGGGRERPHDIIART
jgi:hypothetical protein